MKPLLEFLLNPLAVRMAKTLWGYGLYGVMAVLSAIGLKSCYNPMLELSNVSRVVELIFYGD